MMKKLRLELDELEVESFSTVIGEKEQGTVEGQEWTEAWANCTAPSASEGEFCICVSDRGTCDTGCNPNYLTCNGWSCLGNCPTSTCSEFC